MLQRGKSYSDVGPGFCGPRLFRFTACECGTNHPYMAKFSQEVRTGTKWPYWPQSSCRIEIFGSQRLMFLGRHGCGWQVFERDGKIVDQDKGYFPDKWHQPNFVDSIRSRKAPNADIAICHASACLVHLGNVAFRVGNRRLAVRRREGAVPGRRGQRLSEAGLPQTIPHPGCGVAWNRDEFRPKPD